MNPTVNPDTIEPVREMPKFDIITDVTELSFKLLVIATINPVIESSILFQLIDAIC